MPHDNAAELMFHGMQMKLAILCLSFASVLAAATGSIRGIVHDPQHRPLPGALVTLGAKTVQTDANGEFRIDDVPEGSQTVGVSAQGFDKFEQQVVVSADKSPILHFELGLATVNSSVEVTASSRLQAQTSTVQTMVSPEEIQQTPGADQTNSLAMITDFTPGAYMVHDMLHMRGGHQVNWFFDGIPLINTNIASNVASLINPKNVEELQVERGGYSSEYGDRTYGFFNVVTPSGFESNNEGEFIATAGNFYSTDDQIRVGSHTQRFAYSASVDANRSELGLGTPVSQVIHDQESGAGGLVPRCSTIQRQRPVSMDRIGARKTTIRSPTSRISRPPVFAISIWRRITWAASTTRTASRTTSRSASPSPSTTTPHSTLADRRTCRSSLMTTIVPATSARGRYCKPRRNGTTSESASKSGASAATLSSASPRIPARRC